MNRPSGVKEAIRRGKVADTHMHTLEVVVFNVFFDRLLSFFDGVKLLSPEQLFLNVTVKRLDFADSLRRLGPCHNVLYT